MIDVLQYDSSLINPSEAINLPEIPKAVASAIREKALEIAARPNG
jgi:hypothetical protein